MQGEVYVCIVWGVCLLIGLSRSVIVDERVAVDRKWKTRL